jgi:transglutaminase-like putative cysteine protease
VLTELIDFAYDREHSVIDSVASFTYLVPREEAARRIGEFARQVEGILNDVLEDDYSDFEKALALYDYFSRNYHYDYETEQKMYTIFVDYTTTYRLFATGTGICFEIARAYSYLLMQAGVDASTVMGNAHEWSCARINGITYHVDPTYALDTWSSLAYFMMTDAQREATGHGKDGFVFVSNYSQDHPHPDYTAADDTCAPLWERQLDAFFPQENVLRCWQYTAGWEKDYLDFDYTGY